MALRGVVEAAIIGKPCPVLGERVHAFINTTDAMVTPDAVRAHCTITEMIFVPNEIRDGLYLLNLQTTSFDLDASPSKPVIFLVSQELFGIT